MAETKAPSRATLGSWLHLLAWPAGLATLLTACGFWNYTPDDGFIHLTFIRNVAHTASFVYAGTRPTYGDTSPLWVLVNSIPVSLAASPLVTAKAVGFLSGVVALWVAVALARRIGEPLAGTLAGLLLLLDPWVLRWTVSGLETPLGVAVLLGAALALQARRWRTASLLAGLAPMVRPDFVPFTALIGLVLLWRFARGPRGDLTRGQFLASVALLLLPGLVWAAYAYRVFGTVVPNTVRLKSLRYEEPLIAWIRDLAPILASSHGIVLATLLGALALGGRSAWRGLDPNVRVVLLAWPVLLFGGFLISRSAVASRYFLPATAFLYVTAACVLTGMSRRFAVSVVVVSCVVSVSLILWRVRPEINEYTRNFHEARQIAAWLNLHASSRDIVAAGDIGYLGFYNEVGYDILDLGGLVTPEMLARPAARAAYVRRIRPRFTVERDGVEDAVAAGRGLPMTALDAEMTRRMARLRIATFLGSPHMQRPGDRVWYSLYELDWRRYGRAP